MRITKLFRQTLAPDSKKSELCLELDISRSTLMRWMSKENEKFMNINLIPKISKITGLEQNEMFEEDKQAVIDAI